jgi:hypothetical protein
MSTALIYILLGLLLAVVAGIPFSDSGRRSPMTTPVRATSSIFVNTLTDR